MKLRDFPLLADENIDSPVVKALRKSGHQVLHVTEMEPGITDELVLQRANGFSALLLTEDKDFGELVFRQRLVHHGVILIRLDGLSLSMISKVVSEALDQHGSGMAGAFTVISPGQVRVRRVI